MSQIIEVKVPDIGDFDSVSGHRPVREGRATRIKVDDAIATLESDKATMDVPSTVAGVVKEVKVAAGRQGQRRLGADARWKPAALPLRLRPLPAATPAPAAARLPLPPLLAAGGGIVEVVVPDIGDFSDVAGDRAVGQGRRQHQGWTTPSLTLESDKATMDVPSTAAGTVRERAGVKLGDKVSEGAVLIKVESGAAAPLAPAARPRSGRCGAGPGCRCSCCWPRLPRPSRWLRPCRIGSPGRTPRPSVRAVCPRAGRAT